MNRLEVVRAGAGSGKTTDLCATVADAVAGGLDPACILATTFTKKAAAELKGRVQARLLDGADGNAEAHHHADRLELAAIGTVHSVAHRLLSRYALEMGLSPRLEVVAEQASERALRELLGQIPIDTWRPLAESAERLGVVDLHPRLLKLLAAKRGNHIDEDDFCSHMIASAQRVCELLAGGEPVNVQSPVEELLRLADEALEAIGSLNDTQKNTAEACHKLRRLRSSGIPPWAKYVEAKRIKAGKKSGADSHLNELRSHASRVRQHQRLHSDIESFAELLADETVRLGSLYDEYKSERGLVDFTDLEILFLSLLENKAIREQLSHDFDLIMVDEFQDTNPLQLAIFQQLRTCSPRNRWVGDHKQAIYGFRDTDPKLVDRVWDTATEAERTTLPKNYRSQRGLVQLVGELFSPVLGEDACQEPHQPPEPRGVERWLFNTKNKPSDFASLACGIAQLRDEGIRLADMVVLERSNAALGDLAAALDDLGIPYLLESPGLLGTREGALVVAGLRLVADRSDSLAVATVLHLTGDPHEATPSWLLERLEELREDEPSERSGVDDEHGDAPAYRYPWANDPRLQRLESIDPMIGSPTLVVHQTIEALGLPDLVAKWGDASRRCSHLDSMLRHAGEYEEMMLSAGQAVTLSGLILYLEQLAADGQDVRYPPRGHEAVTLMTYHGAKGLEWPVVILSGLDSQREPKKS